MISDEEIKTEAKMLMGDQLPPDSTQEYHIQKEIPKKLAPKVHRLIKNSPHQKQILSQEQLEFIADLARRAQEEEQRGNTVNENANLDDDLAELSFEDVAQVADVYGDRPYIRPPRF